MSLSILLIDRKVWVVLQPCFNQCVHEGCCVARGALRRRADDRGCAARSMPERLASLPASLPVHVREIRSRVCARFGRGSVRSLVCMSFGFGQRSPPDTTIQAVIGAVRSHMVG